MGFVFIDCYSGCFVSWDYLFLKMHKYLQHQCRMDANAGKQFFVKLDGMGQLLCLLTAVAFPAYIYCHLEYMLYKRPIIFLR